MENIGEWIFKIIWMPLFVINTLLMVALTLFMFKQVGWDAPYRWVCLIALLAFMADYFVNK